jgi:CelD/BcsL family acetyltransferase involved in cellulose biosynthesis
MTSRSAEITQMATTQERSSKTAEDSVSLRLDVDVVSAHQLCGLLAQRWDAIRATNPRWSSPYFSKEFTKAVARVRDDVEIAVIRKSNEDVAVGFLPFQRVTDTHAEPVGGRLNDVHGMIGIELSDSKLVPLIMEKVGLKSFGFHAAVLSGDNVDQYEFEPCASHFIDLSQGWDTYRKWIRKHSSTVKRQGQKTRRLEREVGPIRFEFDCTDGETLEQLIDLKRNKYQRTKTFDILSVDWASNLLREVATIDKPEFKGLLSAMWAGDELVACHFGILTGEILHYWFPTFDNQYNKYSPGTELILRVAEQAAAQGVTKVDFGYGDDPYKFKFCNQQESLSCGRFTFSRFDFKIAKARHLIRKQLKQIPMKPLAKQVLRGVFPQFGQWNFK